MNKYPFECEIGNETRRIDVYGDTPEYARDEARWSLARIHKVSIREIENMRLAPEYWKDDYGI